MSAQPLPVSTVQTLAPAGLDRLVIRCLAKDPEDRWQSSRDLQLELAWIGAAGPLAAAVPADSDKRSRERVAWAVASLALVTLIAGRGGVCDRTHAANANRTEPIRRFSHQKASYSSDVGSHAISPNGRRLVFIASTATEVQTQLWVRPFDSLIARPLAGTDGQPCRLVAGQPVNRLPSHAAG